MQLESTLAERCVHTKTTSGVDWPGKKSRKLPLNKQPKLPLLHATLSSLEWLFYMYFAFSTRISLLINASIVFHHLAEFFLQRRQAARYFFPLLESA